MTPPACSQLEITPFGDVTAKVDADGVATVEIHRPPENFFDVALIRSLADAYEAIEARGDCGAIVLCSEGKHFCAGADFSHRAASTREGQPVGTAGLYQEGARLFRASIPVVAAVHGAAVGGGLGLACSADFRVSCPEARFAANFARLGFHHGFGLSLTLPALAGQQRALELLYTGRRISGEEAYEVGICDRLVDRDEVRAGAHSLAAEIASSAPLAVRSIRATMRKGLLDGLDDALEREAAEQDRLRASHDFAEGVRAMSARRSPRFEGR
jgi:enoyl-CoA hydratase/carnithine racemase